MVLSGGLARVAPSPWGQASARTRCDPRGMDNDPDAPAGCGHGLGPVPDVAAIEAALDTINAVIGAYSTHIRAETARPVPDLDALAGWHQARRSVAAVRWQLSTRDLMELGTAIREAVETPPGPRGFPRRGSDPAGL